MRKGKKRPTRGTLNLIAGLLVASAIVRVAGAGQVAMAEGTIDQPEMAEAMADPAPTPVEAPQETDALLAAFQQREARLVAREAQLADRLQALRVAEVEISQQLVALEAAEERLASTIALADIAAETDIGTLVAVYENMKPKDAAALFEQMTPEFAGGFLGLMDAESAAAILQLVPPDIAYSISVVIAGRNANVPTQ